MNVTKAKLTALSKVSAPAFTADEISGFADHLRVLEGEYTANELTSYLASALDIIERETNRIFRSSTYVVQFRGELADGFRLPVFPVTAVTSVTSAGGDAVSAELVQMGGSYGLQFDHPLTGDFTATITAGYSGTFPPPASFIAVIYAVAADLFEHRTSQSEMSLTENRTVKYALDALRIPAE